MIRNNSLVAVKRLGEYKKRISYDFLFISFPIDRTSNESTSKTSILNAAVFLDYFLHIYWDLSRIR